MIVQSLAFSNVIIRFLTILFVHAQVADGLHLSTWTDACMDSSWWWMKHTTFKPFPWIFSSIMSLPCLMSTKELYELNKRFCFREHAGRFPNLDNDIEEGICQVIAHIWLKEELEKLKRSVSRETKRLGEFFLHQIETDSSPIYGDGFRAAYTAYKNYGLAKTLNHLRNTGRILQ